MFEYLLSLEGFLFLMRWLHFFFGIIWIGILYYFNFVQGPFFAETDASTKSNATQKLVPRALWWFRWGAMWTLTTGLVIYMARAHQAGGAFFATSYGLNITTGALFAVFMAANVWFVIWPNQKVVIQSATQVAQGGQAIGDAASRAAQAGLASRHNVLFSIPMLFFMGAASHLNYMVTNATVYLVVASVIILGIEVNALKGKMGPLATIKGVITAGFALTFALVALIALTQ